MRIIRYTNKCENYSIDDFLKECGQFDLNKNSKPGNKTSGRVKRIKLNLDISDTVEKDAFFGVYVCSCGAVNAIRENPMPSERIIDCGNCKQTVTIRKGG